MAEIKFACQSCGQHIATEEEYIGMPCQCPICHSIFLIPDRTSSLILSDKFYRTTKKSNHKSKSCKKQTHKLSAKEKFKKLCLKYNELEDFFISSYDTPTQKQVMYALCLGILLEGQNFQEISHCISKAQLTPSQNRKIYVPIELEKHVYKYLINNSHDKFVTKSDIENCFQNERLILPHYTTYRQLKIASERFGNRFRMAKCPYCGTMIYNGDGNLLGDNQCSTCWRSLMN